MGGGGGGGGGFTGGGGGGGGPGPNFAESLTLGSSPTSFAASLGGAVENWNRLRLPPDTSTDCPRASKSVRKVGSMVLGSNRGPASACFGCSTGWNSSLRAFDPVGARCVVGRVSPAAG